jgi:hypothetical protein
MEGFSGVPILIADIWVCLLPISMIYTFFRYKIARVFLGTFFDFKAPKGC